MSAPTSGLARLTIRAPRRRLDLAVPHQVPLAELLPEVLRRAGETGEARDTAPVGGWMLRRGDGAALTGDVALAPQGVRDGDVLYLVPRNLAWPEPAYDDVVEEIAVGARSHGRTWDAAATRTFALVAAGLLVLVGLALLVATSASPVAGVVAAVVGLVLLVAGGLLSRALGDGVAGATAAGLALPYLAAGAALLAGGGSGPGRLLVGAGGLLLAAAGGAAAVGAGLRVFVAGGTVGLLGATGALLGLGLTPSGAAAIVVVVLVGGVGLAPLLAVRLGKLPLPVVTAAPEVLAAERRPARSVVLAAVVRADEILTGLLLGIAIAGTAGIALLAAAPEVAARLLAGLASGALLLRGRLFPGLAARLPLLLAGLLGLAGTVWWGLAGAGAPARLAGAGLAFAAVVALLATAATAVRRRQSGSPYLGRLADIVDVAAVVALAPVACAVLELYSWVRSLAS